MLHFCSCFNSMFSSNACDNISVKQPEACSLAFSQASPFLVCGEPNWNGKFLELVSVIHGPLPAVSPKGERHAAPSFPVHSQSSALLLKFASQQETCRPCIDNKGKNSERIPPQPLMSHQSALLCSAPRPECRQTLPGLCFNMPGNSCWGMADTSPKVRFQQIRIFSHLTPNVEFCNSLCPFNATLTYWHSLKNVQKSCCSSWDQAIHERLHNKQAGTECQLWK